jgi:hypothetical protein
MTRELLRELFEAEFLREHRDEREAGIGHWVVIVEGHTQTGPSTRRACLSNQYIVRRTDPVKVMGSRPCSGS